MRERERERERERGGVIQDNAGAVCDFGIGMSSFIARNYKIT